LHEIVTRRFIIQKVRSHTPKRAPTACTYTVSGSFSLPSSSRLSLDFPDLPGKPAYTLKPGQPSPGQHSLLRPPFAVTPSTGILTCFPSTTPFGLALPKQCSTPGDEFTRRYLNSFRGEPAISRFDWPFTPSHKSSANFSRLVGSVLQLVLPNLQPAHG